MSVQKLIGKQLNVGSLATNIVTNGNFPDTTGWTAADTSNALSAANNILSLTGSLTARFPSARHSANNTCVAGHKIYIKANMRITSDLTAVVGHSMKVVVSGATSGSELTVEQVNSPTQNTWYEFNGIVTLTDQTGATQLRCSQVYGDADTANGKVMEIKEVRAVNLTSVFGAGNEPSVTECDAIFKDWFSGTTGVRASFSINSQLRQL